MPSNYRLTPSSCLDNKVGISVIFHIHFLSNFSFNKYTTKSFECFLPDIGVLNSLDGISRHWLMKFI